MLAIPMRVKSSGTTPTQKKRSLEREVERRKKVAARKELVRKAMLGLPLQKGAEARISGLLPVLKSTFYAVKQKNTPATKGRVEEQLRTLVRQSDKLADYLAGMDREAIAMWAHGGGVSYNDAVRSALLISCTSSALL